MSLSFLALGGLPRAVHKSATTEGTAGGENGAAAEGAAAAEVKRALSRLAQVGTSRARAAKISAPSLPVQAIRQLAGSPTPASSSAMRRRGVPGSTGTWLAWRWRGER
mmetsp:Transcript_21568/g.50281  ORF Transcript_21568/g.50281 Transcript_21568/m.50281 type:complete len:108 (+) Transcript_21568:949-1272(+)